MAEKFEIFQSFVILSSSSDLIFNFRICAGVGDLINLISARRFINTVQVKHTRKY